MGQIETLCAFGPLRVWSMVVTIMGDLCPEPGDRIEGPLLGQLTEPMGITNQALRVAVHRLKRDGWIEAERSGRRSSYALTEDGRARSHAVRPLIYADAPAPPLPVHLVLADPVLSAPDFADLLPDDAVLVAPRAALIAGEVEIGETACLVQPFAPDTLPDWVRDTVASDDLCADYARLGAMLTTLGAPLEARMDATVTRLLALHHWRRLRLRHGALADLLLPTDWAGATARQAVAAFLAARPRPTLAALAEVPRD